MTADWFAYAHAVQSEKDKSRFGKGDVRGIIAPEASNNSCKGGDFIPTLAFGVPGSASMSLVLGAFMIAGIQPGTEYADHGHRNHLWDYLGIGPR